MATFEFTIPQIIQASGLRGYSPRLGNALNQLLNTSDPIEYEAALEVATQEVVGYANVPLQNSFDLGTTDDSQHFEGLPIYLPCLLQNNAETQELLLEAAIVSFSKSKKIVLTELQGRDGSFKELINNGDYAITIKGIICNKAPGYPIDQVVELKELVDVNEALKVTHEVLNAIGVDSLVITDFSCPDSPFQNMQPFTISAVSDNGFELTIDDYGSSIE